jgi:dienelactone hydrolase
MSYAGAERQRPSFPIHSPLAMNLRIPFLASWSLACILIPLCLEPSGWLQAGDHRALEAGQKPSDGRLQPLLDYNGYFPFTPPTSAEAWKARAEQVRQRILVSQGLWPMPTRTPLNAVRHGRLEMDEYAIEKVYFESAPGFYVTGNLYLPIGKQGPFPVVLFAHGHWQDARLSSQPADKLRVEIAHGEERFESGGQSRFQSMCVQLARMGCLVWQWDMLGDSDAIQFSRQVVHKFAKQRPEMNTTEDWGLYSPQAEAHLQSIMGLQTWNSIRSLDFVSSLPDVDPQRIAMTGASGGGTQTMLLAAVDPRLSLSFPAVMVSTSMQGGCTCENASLLRVGTGNIEFASLFAPKPQGMTTANDWTKEMATKGFPEIQQIYKLLGAPQAVMLHRGEHFPHNYNAVSRSGFYTWLNKHFRLGQSEPVIERDYQPLTKDQLTVWNEQHPAPPAADPDFERRLLRWFHQDTQQQLQAAVAAPTELRGLLEPALQVMIGRRYEEIGEVSWKLTRKIDHGSYLEMLGLLTHDRGGEALPVVWLYPKTWNRQATLWLTETGKAGLFADDGQLQPAIRTLVEAGQTVLGVDLLMQGEFLDAHPGVTGNRVVENPREYAGYTYGYNPALFAQRTQDVMMLVRFLRTAEIANHPQPSAISLVALDGTGPIAAAARGLLGAKIDKAAIDTRGFRFSQLLDYRHPMFLPGGAKYLDLPGMLWLQAPQRLWLQGEAEFPLIAQAYRTTQAALVVPGASRPQLTDWLLTSP